MMSVSNHFEEILWCPECRNGSLEHQGDEKVLDSQNCGTQFPVVGSRPILLRSNNALFRVEDYVAAPARVVEQSVSRSRTRTLVKVGTRVFFGWVKYFDYLLAKRPEAMDTASCTYLLGCKIQGRIPEIDIVAGYVGAKHVKHT